MQSIQSIQAIFPVPDLTPKTIRLAHPLISNHNDCAKAYEFIINKFKADFTT